MMHRERLGWPTAWLVAAVLLQSGRAAALDARADDRMAPIVAEVRAQEAKYRDIEYIVKSTIREADPKAPDRPADVTSTETCQVVLQGDRISFKKDAHERVLATRRMGRSFRPTTASERARSSPAVASTSTSAASSTRTSIPRTP